MESQKLFNRDAEFVVNIMSGGKKSCAVKFPTDQQWIDRAAKQKTVQHVLGRGKSRSETLNPGRIDAELLAKIRIREDAEAFDESEAAAVIERLERASVTEVAREGNTFRLQMRVPGATVEHVLGIPKRSDVDDYGRASVLVTTGRRQQEIRINLEPSGTLYDKIVVSSTGYKGSVPLVHKDAAVFEVIAQLRALEDEDDAEGE